MIFDPTTANHLKPWLVRTLEPICDAEPGALADYILALLKHNVPESEMRKELATQLDEFLEKEGPPFIDTLFTVLRTKSYLPYAPASPVLPSYASSTPSADTGIPIPLDALMAPTESNPSNSAGRGTKRSMEGDDRDGRPPKGMRLNNDGPIPRYTNGRGGGSDGRGWGGPGDRKGRPGPGGHGRGVNGSPGQMNGRPPQTYLPPEQKRGICRDYHNNGYCGRGAFCRYSHGDDAVVPGHLFPMNGATMSPPGLPFVPMFPGGPLPFPIAGHGGAYDPHEARMDMGPPVGVVGTGMRASRAPIMPRMNQDDGNVLMRNPGELPVIQDLTPEIPSEERARPSDGQLRNDAYTPMNGFVPAAVNVAMPVQDAPADVDMAPPVIASQPTPIAAASSFRPPLRSGRARGTFSGDAHSFRPERRNDKTLVVEKIPEDKLSLEAVNGWFKKFGTVTNVAVDARNAKALVSFLDHTEAHAAWKSEDAVFNNRFVKVFWHRPIQGQGQTGARMLAASAPLVANFASKDVPGTPVTSSEPSTAAPASATSTPARKISVPSAATVALAAKKELLERQIAEQKSLMASLDTASPEEKKQIMGRLRKLGEEMKSTPSSAAPLSSSLTPSRQAGGQSLSEHERKERERLDKELDLHATTTPSEETTEDLKAKLAKLKAEATSLGIPEAMSSPVYGSPYRGYRGRGRGSRGHFRGAMRGGHPRSSLTLDNRPKKLLVKGVQDDGLQALRDWYETTGQLDSVDKADGGGFIVAFRSRSGAELGMAKGNNIPTIGPVTITWLSPKNSTSSMSTSTVSGSHESMGGPGRETSRTPEADPVQSMEEEVVASGWGGNGDDGDGMGML